MLKATVKLFLSGKLWKKYNWPEYIRKTSTVKSIFEVTRVAVAYGVSYATSVLQNITNFINCCRRVLLTGMGENTAFNTCLSIKFVWFYLIFSLSVLPDFRELRALSQLIDMKSFPLSKFIDIDDTQTMSEIYHFRCSTTTNNLV